MLYKIKCFYFTIFFVSFVIHLSYSQELQSTNNLRIGILSEGIELLSDGFSEINSIFSENNIPNLSNSIGGIGFKIQYTFKERKSAISFNTSSIRSALETNFDENFMGFAPRVESRLIRLNYHRLFNKMKKTNFDLMIGFTFSTLELDLVNLMQQSSGFSSLLSNPNSSNLSFTQSIGESGVNIAASIYQKIRFLRKVSSSFDIGLSLGYYQPIVRGNSWVVSGTGNNFIPGDLPEIKYEHFYASLSFNFEFEFITKAKKNKLR